MSIAVAEPPPAPLPGLWVDDQPSVHADNLPRLEAAGLRIDSATSAAEVLRLLRANPRGYAYVIVDLAMPDCDGVQLIRQIREIDPTILIGLASAHAHEPMWLERIEDLGEALPMIDKIIPLVQSPDFPSTVEIFRALGYQGAVERIFHCPLASFYALSEGQLDDFFAAAAQINASYIAAYFAAHPDSGWVVMGGEPGRVISDGRDGPEPFEDQLAGMAENLGAPVFTYTRPQRIEEIGAGGHAARAGSGWAATSLKGDYYPTLLLLFASQQGEHQIRSHFDTGSPYSFLSYEEMRQLGIVKRLYHQATTQDEAWGRLYSYFNGDLNCELAGGGRTIAIRLFCRLLRRWSETPFGDNYEDRTALLGRNVLIENRLRVILDGVELRTDLAMDN